MMVESGQSPESRLPLYQSGSGLAKMSNKKQGKSIKIEDLKPIYFLYGDEEFLMEESLSRLKEAFRSAEEGELRVDEFDAVEDEIDAVIDSAETVTMSGGRRLVILRNVTMLTAAGQKKLIQYMRSPNSSTVFVMIAHFPDPQDQNPRKTIAKIESSQIFKVASVACEIVRFSLGRTGAKIPLEVWVTERFRQRGKRIKSEAVALLVERTGDNLREISGSIDRICLYAGDTKQIDIELIEMLTTSTANKGIFELVDAVANRRKDLALNTLNRIMDQSENAERVFNLLLRQFRLISRVKNLSRKMSPKDIGERLKIQPFLVSKCLEQSRKFSAGRLASLFEEFKRASGELHSGRYLPESEYETHVLEILISRITD